MDNPDIQTRTEPNKACRLEILVSAYFTVVNGTKMYNKGRTVSWVVDSEEYTLTDLERDIGPYFQWGSYQKANFWFLERNAMKFKLDSDAQLLQLVRSTEVLKLMMIVGRREEMEEPAIHKVRADANVVRKDVPAIAEVMDQEVPNAANVDMGPELTELPELGETFAMPPRAEEVPSAAAMDIGPELGESPEFGETIAGPPRAEEEEKEHFMTVGCDPDGDEPARKGCCATQAELEQELPPPRPKKPKQQRKAKTESVETSNIVVDPKIMSSPGVTTRSMASLSPARPGVTTRRMASLSPASPGVATRRMAPISPGGINLRLIIE